mmetsp:Transcript_33469/g.52078  ORF Transcript_33469/g.52078 Transcript_33469/m.52078 type:complete len:211 (-) Transcript_33469:980-1612(-)
MVSGLVKEQDVAVHQDSTAQRKLHLPATGKAADSVVDTSRGVLVLLEAELVKLGTDLSLGNTRELLDNVLNDGKLSVVSVNGALDEHSLELVRRREVLNLSIGDGPHKSGLSTSVVSDNTVALSTLQVKAGVVQKDLSTISKRELAVAQVLTIIVLILDLLLGSAGLVASFANSRANSLSISLGHVGGQVRAHSKELPLLLIEVHGIDHS